MNLKGKVADGIDLEIIYSNKAKKEMIVEGSATDLEMIIKDKNGEMYEATVYLGIVWTFVELQEIVKQTMLLCDASPVSVKATFLGSKVLI